MMTSDSTLRSFGRMLAACAGIALSAGAQAAATFTDLKGDVSITVAGGPASPAELHQQIDAGTTVNTGTGGRAVLRFDDDQVIVLDQNSSFEIAKYHYDADKPQQDEAALTLNKGGLRAVTGRIGERSPAAFTLRVPQAKIGVQGTDFVLVLENPAYLSVLKGSVTVSNGAGTAVFGKGSLATIPSYSTLATAIAPARLPAPTLATMDDLSAVLLGAGGAARGATVGGAAAGGEGPSGYAVAAGVLGAIAIGAAAAGGGGGGSSTTSH